MKHRVRLLGLLVLTVAVSAAAATPNGTVVSDSAAALIRIAALALTGLLWAYWLHADKTYGEQH